MKIQIYEDGNSLCAVEESFINLQESIAGFGNTPKEAMIDLILQLIHAIEYWQAAKEYQDLVKNNDKDGFGLTIDKIKELYTEWPDGYWLYGFKKENNEDAPDLFLTPDMMKDIVNFE